MLPAPASAAPTNTTRTLLTMLALSALVVGISGCAPGRDPATRRAAADTGDSDTAGSNGFAFTEANIDDMVILGMPWGFYQSWVLAVYATEYGAGYNITCPVISRPSGSATYQIEGGCSTSDASFEGSATYEYGQSESPLDLDGWTTAYKRGADTSISLTGRSSIIGGISGAEATIREASLSSAGRDFAYTYSFEETDQINDVSDLDSYTIDAEVDGIGAIQFDATGLTISTEQSCDKEPDAGTLEVATGSSTLVLTFDGASDCDGCVPYEVDGVSGESCSTTW